MEVFNKTYLELIHKGERRWFKRTEDIDAVDDGIRFFQVSRAFLDDEILIYELMPKDFKPEYDSR